VTAPAQLSATEHLVEVARNLSLARDLSSIMLVVRRAAREITGADGAAFVLREGSECFYADEDAIGPLWKGRRFPLEECISGWAMLHQEPVVIEDVRLDPRIPQDAYRTTFVRSLAVVPIRATAPVGAIGVYWAAAHRASDGEVKLLGALADLTSVALANVQLYTELQARMREAEDAVGARDEFISLAAHELRTPVTALQLQLQSLEELAAKNAGSSAGGTSGGVDRRFAERTGRAAAVVRRLASLVDGLFDASRVTYTGIPLTPEEFDLSDVTREVAERFAAAARRARCELDVEARESVVGRWDRARIEQVLTTLLSNAIKYGAGKPIHVLVESRADAAHLEVRDHGVGIAPDVAQRIFERFGRSGPVTRYAGLGLGLYLARQMIEAHGGKIGFQSRHGDGSTFTVTLPCLASEDARSAALSTVSA
jgi:signal transduction histidine kinase